MKTLSRVSHMLRYLMKLFNINTRGGSNVTTNSSDICSSSQQALTLCDNSCVNVSGESALQPTEACNCKELLSIIIYLCW